MKDKEFAAAVANNVMPVAHVVAMDGVCMVIHPSNPNALLNANSPADHEKVMEMIKSQKR